MNSKLKTSLIAKSAICKLLGSSGSYAGANFFTSFEPFTVQRFLVDRFTGAGGWFVASTCDRGADVL